MSGCRFLLQAVSAEARCELSASELIVTELHKNIKKQIHIYIYTYIYINIFMYIPRGRHILID